MIAATSIVGILAACVYPVIAGGVVTSNTRACQNNLKQIGLAFAMYAADNNDTFPLRAQWESGIYPYARHAYNFIYPSIRPPQKGGMQPATYGANSNLFGMKQTKFSSPSVTIIALDYKTTYANMLSQDGKNQDSFTNGVGSEKIDAWGGISRLGKSPVKAPIHDPFINVALGDCHVEMLQPNEISSGNNARKSTDPATPANAAGTSALNPTIKYTFSAI